jgi:hypothetical protein
MKRSRVNILIGVGVLLLCLARAGAEVARAGVEKFVAPWGTADGDGSLRRPLNLGTALSGRGIRPGDRVWLRGGVYKGNFISYLTGAEKAPIVVRQVPGERAIIDGFLTVKGAYTYYWGFEVTSTEGDHTKDTPGGINVFGPGTKFINLVIHDTSSGGFGFWSDAVNAEIYGCLVFRNGWQGPDPDRGHGHAIYVQNAEGTKRMVDNILFDQYGWGIHAYTQRGSIKGMYFEGNVSFNNGSSTRQSHRYDNILVGGSQPAERITLLQNFTYHTPSKGGSNVRLRYTATGNRDLICRENLFAYGGLTLSVGDWTNVAMTRNQLVGASQLVSLFVPEGASKTYTWKNNTYAYTGSSPTGALPFAFQGQSMNFRDWKIKSGFDTPGWMQVGATGTQVFVRPNRYEAGRAHIIVYNWSKMPFVQLGLQNIVPPGARYEVRNAQNYFGAPVASGVSRGGYLPLLLPMTSSPTGPEFGVFVVTSRP